MGTAESLSECNEMNAGEMDRPLNNTRPFNDSSDRDMLTAAVDVAVTF
jgi:hypothetical protein